MNGEDPVKDGEKWVVAVPCPACPDGQVWNSEGPTGRRCPVCKGRAVLGGDEDDATASEQEGPTTPA
jgi:hypothetical protein